MSSNVSKQSSAKEVARLKAEFNSLLEQLAQEELKDVEGAWGDFYRSIRTHIQEILRRLAFVESLLGDIHGGDK